MMIMRDIYLIVPFELTLGLIRFNFQKENVKKLLPKIRDKIGKVLHNFFIADLQVNQVIEVSLHNYLLYIIISCRIYILLASHSGS